MTKSIRDFINKICPNGVPNVEYQTRAIDFLPFLKSLMSHQDKTERATAAKVIRCIMFRHPANQKHARDIIGPLVELLGENGDLFIEGAWTCSVLMDMSLPRDIAMENQRLLSDAGALAHLLRMLGDSVERSAALRSINCLLIANRSNQDIAVRSGAVPQVVGMLRSSVVDAERVNALNFLNIVSERHAGTLVSAGALPATVACLDAPWGSRAHLLIHLMICDVNGQKTVVDQGIIPQIVRLLQSPTLTTMTLGSVLSTLKWLVRGPEKEYIVAKLADSASLLRSLASTFAANPECGSGVIIAHLVEGDDERVRAELEGVLPKVLEYLQSKRKRVLRGLDEWDTLVSMMTVDRKKQRCKIEVESTS